MRKHVTIFGKVPLVVDDLPDGVEIISRDGGIQLAYEGERPKIIVKGDRVFISNKGVRNERV